MYKNNLRKLIISVVYFNKSLLKELVLSLVDNNVQEWNFFLQNSAKLTGRILTQELTDKSEKL